MSVSTAPLRVLIAGAGLAGLTLARCCEQAGFEVVVLERSDKLRCDNLGLALPFNALRALRQLGLYQAVRELGHQVHEVVYARPDGRTLGRGRLNEAPLNTEPLVCLRRDALHAVLRQGMQAPIHLGARVEGVYRSLTGRIEAECSDRALSGDFDLVVSAEGLRSPLRQYWWGRQASSVDHRTPYWRFVVDMPNHGLQAVHLMGRHEQFSVCPLSAHTLCCHAQVHDPAGRYGSGSPRELLTELFGHFADPVPRLLQAMDERSVQTGRLASTAQVCLARGRVACVGDAAHACSPLLQQGAAMAFEDAICLVEQLKNQPVPAALAAYERLRRPQVDWVRRTSDGPIRRQPWMGNPVGSWLRDQVIRVKGPHNVAGWRQLAARLA